ncbi:MAG: hypothetical protein ACJ8GW_09000 [Massilia sp.]
MHLRSTLPCVLAALGCLGFGTNAHAGEAIFTHTYLAETLPKGALEVEQWVTQRSGRSQGLYQLNQFRSELEYGISDRWTVSLYANAYRVNARDNNSVASRNNYTAIGDGDEVSGGGPVTAGPYVPNALALPLPSAHYRKSGFDSLSVESIYQLLSPYKDSMGLAAYVEATAGPKTRELELKLLAQKNLLNDKLVLAANVAIELEREKWLSDTPEKETTLTFSGGASYQVAAGWRLGLEMRNERVWEGGYTLAAGRRDYAAWFAGPTAHYAGRGFFVTAGYSQQLPWATAYSAAARDELVEHRVYKASEKGTVRVLAGLSF